MKHLRLLLIVGVLFLSGIAFASSQETQAASWGATKVFTTPKKTRGTWYFKEDGEMEKVTITAHTVNKLKLYHELSAKQNKKWDTKFRKLSDKQQIKLQKQFNKTRLAAYNFKFHGIKSFNANGWLATGGDGFYYTPVTKTVKGKKVKALRLGEGANNKLDTYAFHDKKLVK